ncbi:TPA: hypothetical protein HA251_03535 [Candidatus Woesearchaeota archaeon]|nr:hypothetical protein [Candidatus Woesearchaeota archaeon]
MGIEENMKEVVKKRFGDSSDNEKLKQIRGIMRTFEKDWRPMRQDVLSGKIDGREYFSRLNARYSEAQDQIAKVVGAEVFERLYGHPPGVPAQLGDPDIAARAYPKR